MDPRQHPVYISCIVRVPALVAPAVFDAWWSGGDHRSDGTAGLTIASGSGSLRLTGTPSRPQPTGTVEPYRQAPGRLRFDRLSPAVRVELELAPWSTMRSEVGLRYTGQTWLGLGRWDRYHRGGLDVLVAIGNELSAWYTAWAGNGSRKLNLLSA